MRTTEYSQQFYVVAYESGSDRADLPTWANLDDDAIAFSTIDNSVVERVDIDAVPGTFQLLNVLTNDECDQFVSVSESLGFHVDAPVSLPHSVRHNNSFVWVVGDTINNTIWSRCVPSMDAGVHGENPLGLNARFRFYRYQPGDYFKPHTDGAWPGSRVIDGNLVHDAYGDRMSQMTLLLFLSGGYAGGATQFFVPNGESATSQNIVSVVTPKGAALVFPHGMHPLHCLHAGEVVESGAKYIIRTDVLYPC